MEWLQPQIQVIKHSTSRNEQRATLWYQCRNLSIPGWLTVTTRPVAHPNHMCFIYTSDSQSFKAARVNFPLNKPSVAVSTHRCVWMALYWRRWGRRSLSCQSANYDLFPSQRWHSKLHSSFLHLSPVCPLKDRLDSQHMKGEERGKSSQNHVRTGVRQQQQRESREKPRRRHSETFFPHGKFRKYQRERWSTCICCHTLSNPWWNCFFEVYLWHESITKPLFFSIRGNKLNKNWYFLLERPKTESTLVPAQCFKVIS